MSKATINKDEILPVLDLKVLKEKANEAAMKGAIKSIEEYYTGYDSPFKKKITEELKKTEIGFGLKLPDIIALINDSLSKEIELIAHKAVAESYVPMVQGFLTRAEKEVKFSEILQQFVQSIYGIHYNECSCTITKSSHGWLEVKLSSEKKKYNLTLHKHDEYGKPKAKVQKYQFLGLPYDQSSYDRNMELTCEGGTLKIPFSQHSLQDKFISFIGTMIIAGSVITMDCDGFDEEMFPQECYCD